jgi:16S rRNA (uracil1498-N3)-methyltransferase
MHSIRYGSPAYLRRFFIEKIKAEAGFCTITGSEAKHIHKVLRMGRGDRLILMDNKGVRFSAVIESADHRQVRVALEARLPAPAPSPIKITLLQSVLKSNPMDYLIQKTSELGVDLIVPFFSERTVVRPDKEGYMARVRHWREVARSAAKQSGRITPANIYPLNTFHDLADHWGDGHDLKVILWEGEESRSLKGVLRSSFPIKSEEGIANDNRPYDEFTGMVGPEGGFSEREVELAQKWGFIPVSLGQRILRAETAAITMVALIQYEWGDLSLS